MRGNLFRSVQGSVVTLFLVFVILGNVASTGVIYRMSVRNLQEEVRSYLRAVAEPAALSLGALLGADQRVQAQTVLANLLADRRVTGVELLDNQGRYMMGQAGTEHSVEVEALIRDLLRRKELIGTSAARDRYVLALPVTGRTFFDSASEDLQAVLLVVTSPGLFLQEKIDYLLTVVAINLATTGVLSVLFFFVLRGYVFLPLRRISEATERLSTGEYPTIQGGATAEFREVYSSFNRMSASLKGAQARLQALNQGLQDRVEVHTRELSELRDRFRDIAETVGDILWEVDFDGRYTFCSQGMRRVLGFEVESVLGRPLTFSLDALRCKEAIREIRWRIAQELPFEVECTNTALDHQHVLLRMTGRPFFDDGGRCLGFRGASRDITAERKLEDTLQRAQRLQHLGAMVGGVAHDFNNILNVIKSRTAALLEELGGANTPTGGGLAEVRQAAERAAALIRRLLVFGREEGRAVKMIEPDGQLERLAEFLKGNLGKGIEVDLRLAGGDCRVEIDPTQFDQVFLNLALNSRDAMPQGGRIEVSSGVTLMRRGDVLAGRARRPGPFYRVVFRDTGSGVREGVREQIFEPFFTTKPDGQGSGLGLAIVFSIVHNDGGTVRILDSSPAGTSLEVLLPVVGEEVVPEPPEEIQPLEGGLKVLVVDDDEQTRRVLARMLQRLGCEPLGATGWMEADSILAERAVDLILLDLEMPDVSGEECLQRLRGRYGRVSTVVVSGYLCGTRQSRLEALGVEWFMAKPFDLAVLRECIAGAAGARGGGRPGESGRGAVQNGDSKL